MFCRTSWNFDGIVQGFWHGASRQPGLLWYLLYPLVKVRFTFHLCFMIPRDMFQPLAAPRDNELENLYQKLGAKWLTSCITTKYPLPFSPCVGYHIYVYFEYFKIRIHWDPQTNTMEFKISPINWGKTAALCFWSRHTFVKKRSQIKFPASSPGTINFSTLLITIEIKARKWNDNKEQSDWVLFVAEYQSVGSRRDHKAPEFWCKDKIIPAGGGPTSP